MPSGGVVLLIEDYTACGLAWLMSEISPDFAIYAFAGAAFFALVSSIFATTFLRCSAIIPAFW